MNMRVKQLETIEHEPKHRSLRTEEISARIESLLRSVLWIYDSRITTKE